MCRDGFAGRNNKRSVRLAKSGGPINWLGTKYGDCRGKVGRRPRMQAGREKF
jgi:hypothetical protein